MYIGKAVNSSIEQITKELSFRKISDCIGYSGYRNITMTKSEQRIDIICDTDSRDEILKDELAPSGANWIIIDIFEYIIRPKQGKGFYQENGQAQELLDLGVLFEPLEEQLYLPTVLIEVSNLQNGQFHCIRQEYEFTALLLIEEPHEPKMWRKEDLQRLFDHIEANPKLFSRLHIRQV